MNLAPTVVSVNFQEITIILPGFDAMMSFKHNIDQAIARYKLFLEGTPYYPDIFEDAANGLCTDLESIFNYTLKTNGPVLSVHLYHTESYHMAYVSLLNPSIHNCKRRLFKYLH